MNLRPPISATELRGVVRLATDATIGITDLVEAMHSGIARRPGGPPSAHPGRTRGPAGWAYGSVRGVTHLVGAGLGGLLSLFPSAPQPEGPEPRREALLAALNGVLGDHLAATDNPLAIPMALRLGGRDLPIDRGALAARLPDARPGLVLLVHGLCMNDLQWAHDGRDLGASLAQALGLTPVYLRYNSGLHVSTNGRALSGQIEELVARWPRPVERVVLVGHSMGGLLARSAVHLGRQSGLRWPGLVSDMVFLGTPHHGAPLERAGHGVDLLLGAVPYAAPLARVGKVRSAGITDLRHGNLLDEDWTGLDRFAHHEDRRHPVPLPADIRSFAVAGSIGQQAGSVTERLLGDGLVPRDSALGRHPDPARELHFAPGHCWIGQGIGHVELMWHAQVEAKLVEWLDRH